MTDQLITELGSISALRVISRTSTMHYKDTRQTVPEIAQQLNVAAVVQGSVLRSGNHVRITVQLTDGKTDRNLWAQSYEREMEDIFTLQAEVASAIASEVQATLTPQERAHLLRNVKVDPEAYQLYLRGRFLWEQRTPEGFQKALARFHDAISKDPTYAQAYCGLADTYILQENYGLLSFKEAHSLALAAAVRAIELDSTLAEAHTSLASIRQDYDWDWAASESEYRRAIELNPSYATAHQWYGNLLSVLGRHNEAILHGRQARQLAPLSARIAVDLGYVFFHARQYDNAIQEGLKALELEPNLASSHELLGRAYLSKNLGTKAIAEFQAAAALTQNNKTDRALLAYSYAKTGRKDLALKTVGELSSVPSSSVPFYRIAMIYVALDKKQNAMLTLEQAFSSKQDKWLQLIGVEEAFDPLRSQPRFQAIVKGLQLTK
jgi:tetratricopeptide (TPR) repeat protein